MSFTLETDPNTIDELAPKVDWEDFVVNCLHWYQGEHVGCIGPTGSGKTTLILHLIRYRKAVTVIGTKPRDSTLQYLIKERGFVRVREWDMNLSPAQYPRRVFWPKTKGLNSTVEQSKLTYAALKGMYEQEYWCVVVDELWYLVHELKLEQAVRVYLQQGRSLGISLVVGTQRPSRVPLEVYDQSTHLFFWRDNDENNLKRISGISWRSSHEIMSVIANLKKHEVLYINTRTGDMLRTMSPPPGKA